MLAYPLFNPPCKNNHFQLNTKKNGKKKVRSDNWIGSFIIAVIGAVTCLVLYNYLP